VRHAGAVLRFELDDLSRPPVVALLAEHLAEMHATSPAESVHALDVDELRSDDIAFWTAWEGVELQGSGALLRLSPVDVEIKSMRTATCARGRGVGDAMVTHLLAEARRTGYARALLETGAEDFFAPARRLYGRHGFVERGPFASYVDDPNSVYMEVRL
jgi:putative acetyltransferase